MTASGLALIELNQQLKREREESMAAARNAWRNLPPRMIIVANRLPLVVQRGDDGRLKYTVSPGGMVSALLRVRHVSMSCSQRL